MDLPRPAAALSELLHGIRVNRVDNIGHLGDIAINLVFLCLGLSVAMVKWPKDPELLDPAGQGEQLFDGGILADVRSWVKTDTDAKFPLTSPSNAISIEIPATEMVSGLLLLRSPSAWIVASIMSVR